MNYLNNKMIFGFRKPQRFIGSLFGVALLMLAFTLTTPAQSLRTATVDGVINATALEYGNNEENIDRKTSGAVTWWMTWDDTNLYIATAGATLSDGTICYVDYNPIIPTNGGTNLDGNLSGVTYDGARYNTLPIRADFVVYYKDGTREYRRADGAGGWTAPVTSFGQYASNINPSQNVQGNQREIGISWSNITGSARPTGFAFLCYAVQPSGFVYGQVPLQNPGGFAGTNAVATHFFRIFNSIDPVNKPPFSILQTPGIPTAASGSIGGRLTIDGTRGIARATVTLSSADGSISMRTITNQLGYYQFEEVLFGGTYIVSVGSKRYVFSPDSLVFNFIDNMRNIDFTASER
jgi:hypothetical protein